MLNENDSCSVDPSTVKAEGIIQGKWQAGTTYVKIARQVIRQIHASIA